MGKQKAYGFAILGAALWGLIGLFVKGLYEFGFTPWEVVAIRVIASFIIMVSALGFLNRDLLKIKAKDSFYFIGTGIISIVFFNWCYFAVIDQSSLSLAVILLYTGPIFVALISRLLFKEALTRSKLTALISTITGCGFVVGLLPFFKVTVSWYVLLVGLGSGFCYALYSIFGKYVSSKYSSLTITTYSFLFASLFMIPAGGLWDKARLFLNWEVLALSIGLGLIPTCLAYILYTNGLSSIEASKASILATIEPVVAIILGVTVLHDAFSSWQFIGILLVFVAILLTTERKKANKKSAMIDS
ncbi:threonine/homoserine efflux transporter RhtA [Scopulibacillus darangshiensis]|uniref:Threonine/homoserine efflux transporter RhtA n=2 Tax=Scopulibacillus darangshiensis TaxID=442528 RepID=A0A4R2P1Z5_9BACL|nr:EamA family transporter [Scopulibacillus darangshiensis]TCP28729.1 threonine/homoserine efflux transporter RhtA [Scopulibacillus darangshiensis]